MNDPVMDIIEKFQHQNRIAELTKFADPEGWLYGLVKIGKHAHLSDRTTSKKIKEEKIIAFKAGNKWISNTAWFMDFLYFGNSIIGVIDPGVGRWPN